MSTLELRGVALRRETRAVLAGIDLEVKSGEVVALMGASGAGKSTLLRAIAALEPFDAGSITVGDVTLSAGPLPPAARLGDVRRNVGFVFQAHALFEHLNALDNVSLSLIHVLAWSRERAEARAHELLSDLGVHERVHAMPRQLSGGEAQRVAIARALAPDPAFLLMDEPTAALDPDRRATLARTLRELAGRGRGMLVATHDLDFAKSCADRVLSLTDGRLTAA